MTAEPLIEVPIEPDLPICEAHHHLWDRPGNRYLLTEFLADTVGLNIKSTIYVECEAFYRQSGSEALKPVGETEFVEQLAQQVADNPSIDIDIAKGIVGFANLNLGEKVALVLDAHMATSRRFRGIRHCAAWDLSDKIVNAHTQPTEGMLLSDTFCKGFAQLAKRELRFDAWVFHRQLPELSRLARRFPDTVIILDHLGGPLLIGPYRDSRETEFAYWKREIRELASCANVYVKLGGIQMPMSGWAFHKRAEQPGSDEVLALTRDWYLHAIDAFGVDRCMFESNFPADKPSVSYSVIWNVFKKLTQGFSDTERAKLFNDNALAAYGI
ncbi:MAG: putative TIM-barrel fold metal-dependent hydrolase [Marinomonas primoryensis]